MQREHGVDARVVTRAELSEIVPDWNVDDVPLAAWEPGSGYGDGAGVANDFLERAREMGVVYRSQTRVTGFLTSGGRVTGVSTDRGEVAAPVVVAATGPWSRPLFAGVGFDLPVEGEYHQVAILKNPPGFRGAGPGLHRRHHDDVLPLRGRRPDARRRLLGQARRRPGSHFPQSASAESLAGLVERDGAPRAGARRGGDLARRDGRLRRQPRTSGRSSARSPGARGLYVVGGFSGMGFKISPATGLVVSELLLDGRGETVDISAFDARAIREGRPIKAEWEYGDEEPAAYT